MKMTMSMNATETSVILSAIGNIIEDQDMVLMMMKSYIEKTVGPMADIEVSIEDGVFHYSADINPQFVLSVTQALAGLAQGLKGNIFSFIGSWKTVGRMLDDQRTTINGEDSRNKETKISTWANSNPTTKLQYFAAPSDTEIHDLADDTLSDFNAKLKELKIKRANAEIKAHDKAAKKAEDEKKAEANKTME